MVATSPPKHCHHNSETREPCAFALVAANLVLVIFDVPTVTSRSCCPCRKCTSNRVFMCRHSCAARVSCLPIRCMRMQSQASIGAVLLQCCSVQKLHGQHQHWRDKTIQWQQTTAKTGLIFWLFKDVHPPNQKKGFNHSLVGDGGCCRQCGRWGLVGVAFSEYHR